MSSALPLKLTVAYMFVNYNQDTLKQLMHLNTESYLLKELLSCPAFTNVMIDRFHYYYYYYYYYKIYKAHKFEQARVRGAGVARWGTWLAGKGKRGEF